jgi:hypothetical protein
MKKHKIYKNKLLKKTQINIDKLPQLSIKKLITNKKRAASYYSNNVNHFDSPMEVKFYGI